MYLYEGIECFWTLRTSGNARIGQGGDQTDSDQVYASRLLAEFNMLVVIGDELQENGMQHLLKLLPTATAV
eukprot:5893821-Amphidinium_carterae.1